MEQDIKLTKLASCAGCGANLNYEKCTCKKQVDPRWAVLEQLLDK